MQDTASDNFVYNLSDTEEEEESRENSWSFITQYETIKLCSAVVDFDKSPRSQQEQQEFSFLSNTPERRPLKNIDFFSPNKCAKKSRV